MVVVACALRGRSVCSPEKRGEVELELEGRVFWEELKNEWRCDGAAVSKS
jgi:hypothetical protein